MDYHRDEGCFDAKMLLSGIGKRYKSDKTDDKIESNSIGNWTNGVLNGEGLRQFQKGYGDKEVEVLPAAELGNFINDEFQKED